MTPPTHREAVEREAEKRANKLWKKPIESVAYYEGFTRGASWALRRSLKIAEQGERDHEEGGICAWVAEQIRALQKSKEKEV